MIKIDLHTHSSASHDGGISPEDYAKILESGSLDYIAVTDHNTIALAQKLQRSLGEHIIVGEEIMTREGELLGLFLNDTVSSGMSAFDTAKAIATQGGIVYVPHPLETVRKGLSTETLEMLASVIDIVEVHNGRAVFQNRGPQAHTWARLHNKAVAASSDAHGKAGLGHTYSLIAKKPTAKNLTEQMTHAHFVFNRPPLHSLLYPKYHRFRKQIRKSS